MWKKDGGQLGLIKVIVLTLRLISFKQLEVRDCAKFAFTRKGFRKREIEISDKPL